MLQLRPRDGQFGLPSVERCQQLSGFDALPFLDHNILKQSRLLGWYFGGAEGPEDHRFDPETRVLVTPRSQATVERGQRYEHSDFST
jgi:hypothetical protein